MNRYVQGAAQSYLYARTCELEGQHVDTGIKSCVMLGASTAKILDCYEDDGRTCFQGDLNELLKDPAANKWMEDLTEQLINMQDNRALKMNLWEWTMSHESVKGDKEKALKLIAVLLQSNRESYYHLSLSERNPTLEALISSASPVKLKVLLGTNQLTLYPPPINDSNPKPDKFYVMAYVAMKLKKLGYSERESSLMPYFLARAYEAQSYSWKSSSRLLQPEKFITEHLPKANVFSTEAKIALNFATSNHDLNSIVREMDADSIYDIYLGHAGANFGVDKPTAVIDRKQFHDEFRKDPYSFSTSDTK